MDFRVRSLSAEGDAEPSHHGLGNSVILFIFIGLCLGQVVKHICNHFKLPYTPLLTIIGMGIGAITEGIKAIGEGGEEVSDIEPHTFFLVFLPPLIFESAFSTDWHIVKVELTQILILAGPCLLACAFLTAVVMKYVLDYDDELSFEAAVMFGALISATDPVAVVSLLKELGASRTLSTLIEGESLFNDGTAYVMFSVTLKLVKGESFKAGHIFGEFCRLSFGGPALGILFGIAISFWLKRIVNNALMEANLTIFGTYLVFYTAETTDLEVSGILALVCLGLYMTRSGRTQISHHSEEALHYIWSYLAWCCETLVFLLAGVIITLKVFKEDSVIEWQDYFKCIALYVFLHIIRFLVIFVIKWPMSKLGYGMNWREATVLGYSGLRGAVSLSLALIVKLDAEVDETIKDLVLFHTAGIAILTLTINGTTMGFLVKLLGLMRMPLVKQKMLRNIVHAYDKEVRITISELQHKKNFGKVDWDKLKLIAGTEKIRAKVYKGKMEPHKSDLANSSTWSKKDITVDKKTYSEEELFIEAKHRYLTSLKGLYWEAFEEGRCGPSGTLLLIESAARAIDHESDEIKDFQFIETYFHRKWFDKLFIKLQRTCLLKWFVHNWLYHRLSFEYDVTINYIECHEQCMEDLSKLINHPEIIARLNKEVKKELNRAETKLYKHIEENFPEVTKAIQHKRGGYYLINHLENFIEEMVKHGQMEEKEAVFFQAHLHNESKKLTLNKLKLEFDHPDEDLATHSEISKIFSTMEIHEICKNFKTKHFDRGELIIKRGQVLKHIYYISKGVVHEKAGDMEDIDCPRIKNRVGDLIGLQFIGKDSGKSFSNCYAKTVCTCLEVPVSVFRSVIATTRQEVQLWSYVGPSIIKLKPDQFSRFHDLSPKEVKALLESCEYKIYKAEEEIDLTYGGILIEGDMTKVMSENQIDSSGDSSISEDERALLGVKKGLKQSYVFITPTDKKYVAETDCRIFHMPPSLKEGLLSYNNEVFDRAFHDLDKVTHLHRHQKVLDHHKLLKKQKTTLVGIPHQLAHEDPERMYSNRRLALAHKYGRGGDKSIPKNSSVGSRSRRNSIVPKGEERSTKLIGFTPGKLGQVQPFDDHPPMRERTKSVDHDLNERPNQGLPPIHEDDVKKLSVIDSSESEDNKGDDWGNKSEDEKENTLNELMSSKNKDT